ncbi:peptidylprolyl isomerase [Babesia caballi]|uniref:Peptidylprolyl isomerase n=1 Tax=Babesia caballi TaxID=5871 RepID=A0AAV4LUK6_BABCB|nr:peptidylprolyl isomerase [Babesia caballi]
MGRLPRSAAYFVRTPEVDEFLREFARVRRWHLGGAGVAAETEEAESESVPYRRRGSKGRSAGDRANEAAVTELADDVPADDMLAAAQVMLKGSCIHLDAFISLVVAHNTLVDKIEREAAGDGPQPRRFELHEIMKNARIKDRKVPNPVEGDDLQSILRAAEEQRYQRLVADVNKKFDTNSTKVVQFKPPIM